MSVIAIAAVALLAAAPCPAPKAKKPVRRPVIVQPTKPQQIQQQQTSQVCTQGDTNVNVYVQNTCPPCPVQETAEAPAATKEKPTKPLLGIRGAWGGSRYAPTALLGGRVVVPDLHLGLDVYTQFYWGSGAQILWYPWKYDIFNPRLGFGVVRATHPQTAQDVPRLFDYTLTAGYDLRIVGPLYMTADILASIPNPAALHKLNDKGLIVHHAVGNSLAQSRILVGLMLLF